MDEVFITESGTTEVLSPVLDVELVDLGPTNTELIFVGDVGIQGPRGDIGPIGPVGPQGPTGPGDKTFSQSFAPTTLLTVTHNLSKYPAVTVLTSAGDEVEGTVDHLSVNQLTISFSQTFSGVVTCN